MKELFNDCYVQLFITLKLNALRRDNLPTLTYQQLESALISICKEKNVGNLNQLADIIIKLSSDDLIAISFMNATFESRKMKIDDFSDLFGGDK